VGAPAGPERFEAAVAVGGRQVDAEELTVEYRLTLRDGEAFELTATQDERILAISEGPIQQRGPAFFDQGYGSNRGLEEEIEASLLAHGDLCDWCQVELHVNDLWFEEDTAPPPDSDAPVGILRVDEVQVDDGAQDAFAQAWAWGID